MKLEKNSNRKKMITKFKQISSLALAISSIAVADIPKQMSQVVQYPPNNPELISTSDNPQVAQFIQYTKDFEASTGVKINAPKVTEQMAKEGYESATIEDLKNIKFDTARAKAFLKIYRVATGSKLNQINLYKTTPGTASGEYFEDGLTIEIALVRSDDAVFTHEISHSISTLSDIQTKSALKYYLGEDYQALDNTLDQTVPNNDFEILKNGLRTYILTNTNPSSPMESDFEDLKALNNKDRKEELEMRSYEPGETEAVPSELITSSYKDIKDTKEIQETRLKFIAMLSNGEEKFLTDQYLNIIKPLMDPNWNGENVDEILTKVDQYLSTNQKYVISDKLSSHVALLASKGLINNQVQTLTDKTFENRKKVLEKENAYKKLLATMLLAGGALLGLSTLDND